MANYRDNSNIGWKILSLFLALVLVAGIITGVVFWQKGNIVFNPVKQEQTEEKPDNEEQPNEDSGKPATGENGEELPADQTIPMPMAMAFRSAAALDGESAAYDSVTLTATVKPNDATNKAVDWSIAFVNPSSEWATGKTVTDYATVTPSADGALTAVVENVAAFGEQIVVKATSRDNTSAYATCTVEYLQRTTGYSFGLHGNFHYEVSSTNTTASITPNFATSPEGVASLTVNKSTVYTRENTDKAEYYTIKPTAAFKTAITNAGLTASALKEYSDGVGDGYEEYFGSEWGAALYGNDNAKKNKLITAISGYSGNAYEVIMYESNGGKQLATFNITLDASTILGQKGVESIVIDETEIVF